MSASKKMRELNRARIEHDKSRLMATYAESKNEMVSLVDSALAGKVNELMQQLASRDAEIARLKTIPMRYRRMAFNAQLQDEIDELMDDAARYHFLRDNQHVNDDGDGWLFFSFDCITGGSKHYLDMSIKESAEALDAAIDAAIRARGDMK